MDEDWNFRNEEGNEGLLLFIGNGPWHLKWYNKWMGDTWHASWSDKSTWFLTNKIMTRGTNLLANVKKKPHFPGRPMDRGATNDTRKLQLQTHPKGSSWSMAAADENLVHSESRLSINHVGRDYENLVLDKWCTSNALLFWYGHCTLIPELKRSMWTVANDS